jgi:DNA end-binding protein Ku
MRSIWKGVIAFGLVNVPVKLYSATEDHDIALHQVHDKDGGRIRYQRRCEICGEKVDYEHIDKAYDDGEHTVVLTDTDLSSLPVEKSREIEVVEFVPSSQIDPIMLERSYFLEPDSKSTKAYVLLRRTLEETDRTAVVQFSLRQKSRLGALRVRGDVLLLQGMLWNDEVREARFPLLDQDVKITAKERQMSAALVDSFSEDFTPEKFTDDYQEQLRQLIDAKLEKGDTLATEETFGRAGAEEAEGEDGGKVLDLMEALRRSVEKNRGSKDKPKSTKSETETETEAEAEVETETEAPKARRKKGA